MSEVEPQITASTPDDAAGSEVTSESAEVSADFGSSVVSPHGGHEANETDDTEQPVDVVSNGDRPLDIADLGTTNVVDETVADIRETTIGTENKAIAELDASKQPAAKAKPVSIKPVAGKSNGGPQTPLVKKIINSGTFGTGAVGKAPPTKSTVTASAATGRTIKSSTAPTLQKSTSSSAAPPSKTTMASIRTPAAPAAPLNRRQSLAPAKPTAPPLSKPTLSASASARPSSATSKPATSAIVKPPTAVRPSAVSPTGSATSASSRPRASVSEGVKRSGAALTSRQSLAAGTKPPPTSSTKPPPSRSSTVGTSATATKPTRTTASISSIREVKEDNKALEDLQAQLKEVSESLTTKSESVLELEGRIGELTSLLDVTQAELASKSSVADQLDQGKTSLEKQLAEAKEALTKLETGRQDSESTLSDLQKQATAAKAASAVQEELIESLRAQIQGLEAQTKSTQDTLDILKSSNSSDAEKVAVEREAFLKVTAELAAAAADIEALKAAHAAAAQELDSKVQELETKSASIVDLNAQITGLKEEKEENSGKLSELEVEILELKESQEASEEEREGLSARVKTLEEELANATVATQQAYEAAKDKESQLAAELAEIQRTHEAALKAESETQDALNASLEALKAELAAALGAHEQTKVEVLASVEEHGRRVAEVEAEFTRRQAALQEETKRITAELESQESYYNSKVDNVKEEHNKLLQEAFERAKAEAGAEHTQELQALRAGSSSSIEQIQTANQLALDDLKAEHANILDSEVNRLEKTIATLKLDLKATQDDLAKAKAGLESARTEVESLTQQRDDARASASSAPDSAAHADEVARLSKELAIAKDDLATANEMLSLTKLSLAELSNNQGKELEDAAKGRVEEVTKLQAAHGEEVATLVAQKSELATKVSDLEGELVTLQATIAAERVAPKTNGNGAVPPASPGVTKEELQRLHEAHNLKMHDLAADHEKAIKALRDELEDSHNKAAELNTQVQRQGMEIQYLEQDQEENQDQITRSHTLLFFAPPSLPPAPPLPPPSMAIQKEPGQKGVSWSNIAVGGIMNMVTTLGQPLEVLKTQMAANRSQTMWQACKTVWSRGGVVGYYQGLIPWAWIEASTKGAVLVFTASEVETATLAAGINPAFAGLLGGMTGGVAQAYATMGFTTCMKTAEITRHKTAATGVKPPSTWAVFGEIYRREGLAGVNKGVNAVAVRQCTNWGSRMGFARLAETSIRRIKGKSETESLGAFDKILASTIGGALATWNQPIEVIRVEMQSMAKGVGSANRPAKLTIMNTLSYIYKENGIKGLYRGVTPRIGLGVWQTICMVSLADYVKIWVKGRQ
ncbi:hypothetical protein DXG01_011841 [Tephrocybe rancida]|nr:hypothetical protein DXG01_011841 [Tephrocybe rancida]